MRLKGFDKRLRAHGIHHLGWSEGRVRRNLDGEGATAGHERHLVSGNARQGAQQHGF